MRKYKMRSSKDSLRNKLDMILRYLSLTSEGEGYGADGIVEEMKDIVINNLTNADVNISLSRDSLYVSATISVESLERLPAVPTLLDLINILPIEIDDFCSQWFATEEDLSLIKASYGAREDTQISIGTEFDHEISFLCNVSPVELRHIMILLLR